MPFKSKKHQRYMWAQHPEIARRWTETYGVYGHRKASKRRKRSRRTRSRGSS